jgi:TcpE family
VDLPTYTNIWRIEKRLYKLYDFRLPMPLPINWIAVFAGITIPYIVFLIAIGLPFDHTLVWLYVLPPGLITWLTTRPVIENKRLPELVESQARYLAEPKTWVRLVPLSEKDQMVVTARVWHSSRPAQAGQPAKAGQEVMAGAGQEVKAGREVKARRALRTPSPAVRPAPAGKRSAAAGKQVRARSSALGLGGSRPVPAPQADPVLPSPQPRTPQPRTPRRSVLPVNVVPNVAPLQQDPTPAVHAQAQAERWPSAEPRPSEEMPVRARGGAPAASRLEMSHDGPGRRPVAVVAPAAPVKPVRPVPPENSVSTWPTAARPLRAVRQAPQESQEALAPAPVPPVPPGTGQGEDEDIEPASEPTLSSRPADPAEPTPETLAEPTPEITAEPTPEPPAQAASAPVSDEPAHQPEPVRQSRPEPVGQPAPARQVTPERAHEPVVQSAAAEAIQMLPEAPDRPDHPRPAAQPVGVAASVEEAAPRAVPSIERALSSPSRDRSLSWHGTVKIVTGAGAAQGPGARDQEALDRNRARLPVEGPKRILILGCTTGAGQSVTALMAGYMLASLREQPVSAVDLHDGTLARYRAPAAWLDEILAGRPPQAIRPSRPDGLHPTPKANPARLDVIASHEPLGEGDEIKLAVQLNRHYPLTVLDGGPAGLTKLLKVTDQLVLVAPANVEAAGALADTRDWLDAHGHAELAMQSVTVINGVSRRSLPDVEQAESIARGRSRAIVRVPWDDMLPVAATGPSTLRPQTRVAYTALAGVLVAGLAAAPVRRPQ